ncbi:MAG TPA: response regulator [Rariglobus sp.]|jgi:CheY-like chemotaxis protein|nr:response regulator [Rariglobus sp.]
MRPRILVIDDSKAVRRIAEKALAAFDCVVDEAANGFNGLFAMERNLPDLLLLDVSMPVMDGVEMLTLLKSHPQLRLVPVIMLTSSTDHQVLPKITALGVNVLLKKPFTETAFVETVRGVIKLKSA